MNKLSDERGLARYLRAVRERNIRILVIHPFENWERSLHLVESLKASLVDEGFQLGIAQPCTFSPYWFTKSWRIAGILYFYKTSLLYRLGGFEIL